MATTSMSLGPYWENFLKELVESGRYGTQSEAMRDALRTLEARDRKLEEIRTYLAARIAEADRGEFATGVSVESILKQARARRIEHGG